ncbi:helix-turn-helix domain-containing protein [Burkholderia pseudomallei]|uniref:helix-turn-helix domain-containing protein n=1 Tax=Burkholderia pseudomallei TaxID=28450 RepID=UPI000F514E88|nr:helix-turn-helix domain-containing protein [Burkholderia pseudomallei]RPE23006.1 helix-turn-helix domain-containing protein [Burkholderia pseudomallei]RQS99005.1 helix-turn-helix domain-containing protein [Burkholderia pseudomallei]
MSKKTKTAGPPGTIERITKTAAEQRLASRLDVPPGRARRWISDGLIAGITGENGWTSYSVADLDAFVPPDDGTMSIAEASTYAGFTSITPLRRAVVRGLVGFTLNTVGRRRFTTADVDAFLAQREAKKEGKATTLSIAEAAKALGLDRGTVWRAVKAGRFPATEGADGWRIARADVQAFLKTNKRGGGTQGVTVLRRKTPVKRGRPRKGGEE